MMAHVKVADRWEERTPTPIPSDAKARAHSGVKFPTQFSQPCTYVDDYQVPLNQGTTFRRRQNGLECIGLPRLGSRAFIWTGGGGLFFCHSRFFAISLFSNFLHIHLLLFFFFCCFEGRGGDGTYL